MNQLVCMEVYDKTNYIITIIMLNLLRTHMNISVYTHDAFSLVNQKMNCIFIVTSFIIFVSMLFTNVDCRHIARM